MSVIQLIFLFIIAIGLSSCANIDKQIGKTDEIAYQVIEKAQIAALGEIDSFSVERPSETLRRQLFIEQWLLAPKGLSWDRETNEEENGEDVFPSGENVKPYILGIVDALQAGAQNSNEYQSRKEALFEAALDLDLEANEFRHSLTGLLGSLLNSDQSSGESVIGSINTAQMSWAKKFETGIELTTRIGIDLVKLLTQSESSSLGVWGDASILIPLLRGAGREVVREPLTQAERNVLYEIYSFEQFKADFAVNLIRSYLQVLQTMDQVRNTEENYYKLEEAVVRSRRLADAGRLPEIQVAQAVQDSLSAKDNWLNLSQSYARELDTFKLQLGLPPDAFIQLDFNELQQLAFKGFKGISSGYAKISDKDPDHLFLSPGDEQDEFFLHDRYWLAKALGSRLDLNIAEGEIVDAQRKLDIAANDFLPELDLKMEAYLGESRSYGSWDLDDAELRFERGRYALGLALNSPFNKTPERIAYRRRLLDLAEAIRNYQRAEDTIKLDVRNELRNLAEYQEQVKIQERALEVAEWRVGATEMLLQSGRIEMRDLLDARDSLVLASDNLTDAKLNYKLSEIDLLKASGILRIDNQGLVVSPQTSETQDQ